MPGKRSVEQASFVTPRALYRNNVVAGGETDPTLNTIPILDTRVGPNASIQPAGSPQSDVNNYGKDARINLSILVSGFTSVTLQLWLKSEIEAVALSNAPLTPPTLPVGTQEWMQVASKTVNTSTLWTITDIPPGKYKVLVSAAVGAGFVTLEEQHAA